MADESHSFTTARARLEDIVTQVRKKDTSLEKSLDLLEEGVRLANTCTELIDHADWTAGGVAVGDGGQPEILEAEGPSAADPPFQEEGAAVIDVGAESAAVTSVAEDGGLAEADHAWSDEEESSDELGPDDDPSSEER